MIINAKGAADFAEKYIIHSIWEGHYPPGSKLPAERELSEKMELREQRYVKYYKD